MTNAQKPTKAPSKEPRWSVSDSGACCRLPVLPDPALTRPALGMAEPKLYWPPLRRLHEVLLAADEQELAQTLKRYHTCIFEGLNTFKQASAQSRRVVQEQTSLFSSDGPKVPIREDLRRSALSLSDATVWNALGMTKCVAICSWLPP